VARDTLLPAADHRATARTRMSEIPTPRTAGLAPPSEQDAGLARMRALLDRPLPAGEIAANTELVSARGEAKAGRMRSVLVFEVGEELLALDADDTHRVVRASPVRRVPHRSNAVFAGIANVSVELTPVASVAAALGVPGDGIHTHFIVIGDAGARWAFGSARIEGVRRVDESRIVPAPTTVRHAADGCTKFLASIAVAGVERLVAVLDGGRLAALLARSLS